MRSKTTTMKVILADKLAPSISTRVAIQALRNDLVASPATKILLDFKDVVSISRSATHEMAMMIFDLTNLFKKKITVQNQNMTVKTMFTTIANQTVKTKLKERSVSPKTVDFEELCQMA